RDLAVEFEWAEGDPFFGRFARQVIFRQIRAIHGARLLVAEQSDRAFEAFAAQRFHGSGSGWSRSHDHDRRGHVGAIELSSRYLSPRAEQYAIALAHDCVAGDGR